jgi:PKD repeat protein
VDDVQRYDPVTNTWDPSGPALPQGRMSPQTVWYGAGLYVSSGGGEGGDIWNAYADTYKLDTSAWPAGSWQLQGESVPTPVVGGACDCVNDGLVTAGGNGDVSVVDTLQRLDDGVSCAESPDVSWLSASPASGTVPASGSTPVTVSLNASALGNGTYHGWLLISGDTPYPGITVPVNLTVGYGSVTATAAASATNGSAPLTVNFTGTVSGGDGGPYTYDWNFGDGTAHSNLQNPSHTYASGGTFPVTFTATDGHANSGVDTHLSITVTSPPPVLTGVSPTKGSTVGGTAVTLTGTNFASGATVTFGGSAATGVTFVNSTTYTCTAPTHAEGAVDVALTVPGKPATTLAGAFTYATPASISSVTKKAPPFKLILLGSNFHNPCTVKVNGVTRGTVTWKSATKIVAKGTDLKTACPKGTAVQITVTNTDDGVDSAPFTYTR